MVEINLLKSLSKSQRNTDERKYKKTSKHIKISKEYGHMYFDGQENMVMVVTFMMVDKPVAQDIFEHFKLQKGDKFLDIAKARLSSKRYAQYWY